MTSSGRRRAALPAASPLASHSCSVAAVRPEAMQGDRALGRRAQLEPDQLRRADRRAVDGEGLAVAHIETIARADLALEVDRAGQGLAGLEHHRRRHARLRERRCKRFAHDSGRGDLARERLVGKIARRFVVAAEQALFRGARRLEGHVVVDAIVSRTAATTEPKTSEAASAAVCDVLFMSPQKTNKGQTGATGQGRAKARSIVIVPAQLEGCPSDSQTAPTSGAIRLLAVFLCVSPPLMVDNFRTCGARPLSALDRRRCHGAPPPQILQGLQLLRYRSSPFHSAGHRRP